jgi:hypothetical protein
MTKVLMNTNVAELIRISAGESEVLTRMTEDFEKKVQDQFKQYQVTAPVKDEPEPSQHAASAGQTT